MKPEESIFFKLSTAGTDSKTLMVVQGSADADGDGTSAQYYLQSIDFNASANTGTRLDLQNGKYTSYGSNGRVVINSSGSTMLRIDYRNGSEYINLMQIGSGGYWLRSVGYGRGDDNGSCWNLDTGNFETYNTGGRIQMTPSNPNGLFQIAGKVGGVEKVLMNVGTGNYYLQSADYSDANATGFKLDLANGNMTGYNFAMVIKKGSNTLTLGSKSCTNAIQIAGSTGERFSVHWDGSVFLRGEASLTVESGEILSGDKDSANQPFYSFKKNGGRIGPWIIDEKGIYSGGTDKYSATSWLGTEGDIRLQRESGLQMTLGSNYFQIINKSGGTSSYPRMMLSSTGFTASSGSNARFALTTSTNFSWSDGTPDTYESNSFSVYIGESQLQLSPSSFLVLAGGTAYSTNAALGLTSSSSGNPDVFMRAGDNYYIGTSRSEGIKIRAGEALFTMNATACNISASQLNVNGTDLVAWIAAVEESLTALDNRLPSWIFSYTPPADEETTG